MKRIATHAWAWRLLAALLLLAALATALRPALAQPGSPGYTPLVPNVEPDEATLEAAPPSEEEAVAAALAAFAALPQPATPPAGALLDLPAGSGLDATLDADNVIYLPFVRNVPGQAPTPVTPTATPVTPTPVTPVPETSTPSSGKSADIAVTLWAKPSIWVAHGALLEYEIRLANYGKGDAGGIDVVFPYYRNQYTLESTSLSSKKGDWVSRIDQGSFTVHFGPLGHGASRSGKVYLRINNSLAYQTLLNIRASYKWDGSGGSVSSNWAPVLVGNGASDAPYVWVSVSPDHGAAGTTHTFFSNRFMPGESVSTWLNTPSGVRSLSLRGTADGQGSLTLKYASTGLAKGSYQLVLYGTRSGLTGVANFTVQ